MFSLESFADGWRQCRTAASLSEYLHAIERQALATVVGGSPGLVQDGDVVRRPGSAWFWGVPFRPAPEVHQDEVPASFVADVASAAQAGMSAASLADSIASDWNLLHDERRDSALRILYCLGLTHEGSSLVDRLSAHKDGGVRAVAVGLLGLAAHESWAARRLARLTHDCDDRVFLKAFRAIGCRRVTSALPDLLHIVRHPSAGLVLARMGRDANPVGLGATHVLLAVLQVAGTDDPIQLREVEEAFPPSVALDAERFVAAEAVRRAPLSSVHESVPHAKLDVDWIQVRGADVRLGYPGDHPSVVFKRRHTGLRQASLPPYAIARDPVTNEQYDAWVDAFSRDGGPEFEHPVQPLGKDHTRATWGDARFGPAHPVTGIDWLDAFAFCRYYGVRLPSEDEWEWAATAGSPSASGWSFVETFGRFDHLNQWRRQLNETGSEFPAYTTHSIDDSVVSGVGVRHAVGNAWEYTNTNSTTGQPFHSGLPEVHLRPDQYMSLAPFHVVIKGGAWTSVADLLDPRYQGFDLYSDRHCEIGFRVAR